MFSCQKQYVCRNYLHKRCSHDRCRYYHDPSLVSLPVLGTMRCIESRRRTNHPCAIPCMKDPAPRKSAIITTPRYTVLFQLASDFSSSEQHNRNRIICRNSLNSRCDYQDCPRYHFKRPAVRLPFLMFRQLLTTDSIGWRSCAC